MKIHCRRGSRIARLPLFIALAGAALLAAGCGGESDETASGAPSTQESMPADTAAKTDAAAPAPVQPAAESAVADPEADATAETPTATAGEDMTPHIDTDPEETPETAAAETPAEPAAPVSGRDVYNTYCVLCHRTGLNMAPKYGNKIIWSRVVAKGRETVYRNSLEGIRGMPARGGYAFLTDEQVKAAVDFMVQAGGGWRE